MNGSEGTRRQLFFWGLILGLWVLVVLAFSGQLMIARSLEWEQALKIALRDWFPWLLLAPVVAWLSVRFPLEKRKLALSVCVHLLACALAVLFCEWLSRPGGITGRSSANDPMRPFPGEGGEGRPPFRPDSGGPEDFRPGRPPRPGEFSEGGSRPPNDRDGDESQRGGPPGGGPFGPNRQRRPGDFQPEGRFPDGFPPNRQVMPSTSVAGFIQNAVVKARVNFPIYWVIVSIVHALTYHRRSQERELKALELESRLNVAKLDALRMQLHPHFLFNTLNAISTLVHRDPHAADEMIGNLSELLRATLDTSAAEIPLRQELSFLDRYLEIQQVRFGDRLRIEKEVDAGTFDALVPTLILQPLVENAVRHGIEPQSAPGMVRIVARRDGDVLRLTVRNFGAVTKPGAKTREGIGLPNTRARLQEMYGRPGRLTLTSASEGEFTVDLEIPYHESPITK